MPRRCSSLLLSLLIASAASAVTMDWVTVGDPGNVCEPQGTQGCFGAVSYAYNIGTYEVTNAQYTEFLNAKAASDPLGLYNTNMSSVTGGITRTGASGSYSYSVVAGQGDMPVNRVSFFDAVRFANWLHNGQGAGDTEDGAYTLLGGTPTPSNGMTVTRNAGATVFVTSMDEWYKAAYWDRNTQSYFDYPARSDVQTSCSEPTSTPNSANCLFAVGNKTIKGSYPGSAGPYGTFDQGGNVFEWNEKTYQNGAARGARGGGFETQPNNLAASVASATSPSGEFENTGFRVAPEPGGPMLLGAGVLSLLGLARWRVRA